MPQRRVGFFFSPLAPSSRVTSHAYKPVFIYARFRDAKSQTVCLSAHAHFPVTPPRPGPRLAPGQAAHDYVAEDHYKLAEGADEPLEVERRLYRKTAVAFLKRTAEMKASQMERPVKRQRMKAHSALVRLGAALQSHFHFGLVKYRQPRAVADGVGRPEAWPHLTIVRDEGSDMLSMCHFLQRGLSYNVSQISDPNHAEWNSLRGALKDVGVWGELLVFGCVSNLDYAPWGEMRWFAQLREGFSEWVRIADETDPLFLDLLPKYLDDIGELHRQGEADTPKLVFQAPCSVHLAGPGL